MEFNFMNKLKEVNEAKINTTDNRLLCMILIELDKLNNNIEKLLAGKEEKVVVEIKEEDTTKDKKPTTKK